ncbi:hypothetical protein STEG23_011426 [Scotinomys teguina]
MHLWTMDSNFQRRYEQLENSMRQLFLKAQRIVHKLFSLSKRCHKQPLISLPRQSVPDVDGNAAAAAAAAAADDDDDDDDDDEYLDF